MKRIQREQGITLVATVLLVMVVFISLLLLTTNVVLGSRKSTGDTRQGSRVQYAAESAASVARAQVAQAATLIQGMYFPYTVDPIEVQNTLKTNLCGSVTAPSVTAQTPSAANRASQRPTLPVFCDVSGLAYNPASGNAPVDTPDARLIKSKRQAAFLASLILPSAAGTTIPNYLSAQVVSASDDANTVLQKAAKYWMTMFYGKELRTYAGNYQNITVADVNAAPPITRTVTAQDGSTVTMTVRGATLTDLPNAALPNDDSGLFRILDVRESAPNSGSFILRYEILPAVATATVTKNNQVIAQSTIVSNPVSLRDVGEMQLAQDSFSKYALFTNVHPSTINFTGTTLFGGPVHTNQNFRFTATNGAQPWFGGKVTSAGCTFQSTTTSNPCGTKTSGAYFGSASGTITSPTNMGGNPLKPSVNGNAPVFDAKAPADLKPGEPPVDWNADYVQLPSGFDYCPNGQPYDATSNPCTSTQRQSEQRVAGFQSGLFFSSNLYSLTLKQDNSTGTNYQTVTSCTTSTTCTFYRYGEDNQMQIKVGTSWVNAFKASNGQWYAANATLPSGVTLSTNSTFNGVVYGDGSIDRLTNGGSGTAIARFAQLTVAGKGQIRITGNLTYEDPPCSGTNVRTSNTTVTPAPCNNQAAQNVLGVYSVTDDVLIGNNNTDTSLNAPNDVNIHASIMSGTGTIAVENYSAGSARGAVNLIGGLIENTYGAFGTFNSSTGVNQTGYTRNFVYDKRLGGKTRPPKFPRKKTPWDVDDTDINLPLAVFGGVTQRVGNP
ncbi:DUF4900 domain-containing protein [Deinococcus maricopensis]|uniref:DUF4900 domain-containing protein n=1 Tax=Deinococcus maricopensis TaxID=309887 RepID=UPI00145E3BAD|nr:DUF4900 domain-containing protein [Deinococcus maricopensis]